MAKKNTYSATIKYAESADVLDVDMLNLPYDMFGPRFPLEIHGDVDMGKCKGQDLPDMTNVMIDGAFDCSTCTLTKDSVLPGKITSLICKHSIGSLDVLVGKLPDTLKMIIVRSAIFTAIKDAAKKNSVDKTAYENALCFVDMYPNVVVTDGKKTLRDVLDACAEKVVEAPVSKQAAVVKKDLPEQQTEEWLSVSELVVVCEEKISADVLRNLDKDLKRYVRQALNQKSNIKIETREMRRADGSVVKCVRHEDVASIVEYITTSATPKQDAVAQPEKIKKSQAKKSDVPAAQAGKKKYYIGNREICSVKIKKYISKAAWGQILSKVGKNTNALLKVLQDIEDINTNPALAHTASGQVAFIKDGAVHVSPTVGFKNGRCLAQGFGTLDDRPRIVWGICGNTFVCQNFYPAHEGKVKMEYNALLRTIDIDISKLDLGDFLLVSDLISELAELRSTPVEEKQPEIIAAPVEVLSPVVKESAALTPDVVDAGTAEDCGIADIAVSDIQSAEPEKTVVDVDESKLSQKVNKMDESKTTRNYQKQSEGAKKESGFPEKKGPRWATLFYLNGKVSAEYRAVVVQQQELLNALNGGLDTDKMLQHSQRLCQILEKKQKLEKALKEIEQKNQEIFDFIKQINIDIH